MFINTSKVLDLNIHKCISEPEVAEMTTHPEPKALWQGLLSVDCFQVIESLGTQPFKFIVGPDKKEFLIHKDIVARLSAPLNTLVNGQMKEAAEGCVVLDDVDEDIFMRFAQFAYTGSYTTFNPADIPTPAITPVGTRAGEQEVDIPNEKRPRLEDTAGDLDTLNTTNLPSAVDVLQEFDFDSFLHNDAAEDFVSPFAHAKRTSEFIGEEAAAFRLPYSIAFVKIASSDWLLSHVCKNQKPSRHGSSGWKRKADQISSHCLACCEWTPRKKKAELIESFMAHSRGSKIGEPANSTWMLDISTSPTKTFESVFLGHASVWVFADRYAINSLMDLSCSHLVSAMAHWRIFESTFITEFGALIRYVYGNTFGKSYLRLILAHFAACVVEDVSQLEGWALLLNDEPDFGVDLVSQMTTRF